MCTQRPETRTDATVTGANGGRRQEVLTWSRCESVDCRDERRRSRWPSAPAVIDPEVAAAGRARGERNSEVEASGRNSERVNHSPPRLCLEPLAAAAAAAPPLESPGGAHWGSALEAESSATGFLAVWTEWGPGLWVGETAGRYRRLQKKKEGIRAKNTESSPAFVSTCTFICFIICPNTTDKAVFRWTAKVPSCW